MMEREEFYNVILGEFEGMEPGLTGWAQINGRDELPIDVKAKLDGEYIENMGLKMDVKCFFGNVLSVVKSYGVVEGGTGRASDFTKEKQAK